MTVPEAIDIAKHHLSTTLPEFSDTPVQLEELETPPHGSKWRFTFSTSLPITGNAINFAEVMRSRRISKSVEIDPSDGALLAVKNAIA